MSLVTLSSSSNCKRSTQEKKKSQVNLSNMNFLPFSVVIVAAKCSFYRSSESNLGIAGYYAESEISKE
ncbi:hypothetical protein BpHYR1_010928 [Brachionus plicatilis]|uniref:Uncharacterized protein n=1 Tax=Brachionus plicatilis TaxID=10195 RepID=A0A3M7QVR8_BRAPC|nr:hypothetical protein BpHYR1_010928 [Brachionus plicatilis]